MQLSQDVYSPAGKDGSRAVSSRLSQVPIESRYSSDPPRLPFPLSSPGLSGSPSFSNLDFYPGQVPTGLEPDAPYSYVGNGMVPVHTQDKRKSLTGRSRTRSVGEKDKVRSRAASLSEREGSSSDDRARRKSQVVPALPSHISTPPDQSAPNFISRQQRRRSRTLSGVRPLSRGGVPAPSFAISAPALPDSHQSIRYLRNDALATLTGGSKLNTIAPPAEQDFRASKSVRSVRTIRNDTLSTRTGAVPRLDLGSISSFDIQGLMTKRQSRMASKNETPTVVITEAAHASPRKENELHNPSACRSRTQTELAAPRPSRDLRHSRSLGGMMAMSSGQDSFTPRDPVPALPTTLAQVNAQLRREKQANFEKLLGGDGDPSNIADADKAGLMLSRSFSRLGLAKKQSPVQPIAQIQPHYRKIARSDTSPHLQRMLESAGLPHQGSVEKAEANPRGQGSERGRGKDAFAGQVDFGSFGRYPAMPTLESMEEVHKEPHHHPTQSSLSAAPISPASFTAASPTYPLHRPPFDRQTSGPGVLRDLNYTQESRWADDAMPDSNDVSAYAAEMVSAGAVQADQSADSGSRYSLNDGTLAHSLESSGEHSSRLVDSSTLSGEASRRQHSLTAMKSSHKSSFETVDRGISLAPQIKKVTPMPWEEDTKATQLETPTLFGGPFQRNDFAPSKAGSIKSVRTLRKKLSNKLLSIFSPGQLSAAPTSPGISHASYFSSPPPSPAFDAAKFQSTAAAAAPSHDHAGVVKVSIANKMDQVLAWRDDVTAQVAASKLSDMISRHLVEERSRMEEKYGVALDVDHEGESGSEGGLGGSSDE